MNNSNIPIHDPSNRKVLFTKQTNLPPILKKRKARQSRKDSHFKEFESTSSFYWHQNGANETNENDKLNNRVYKNGPGPGKYSRPTSIGHLNHDITIRTEPAFSMSKAERFLEKYECIKQFRSSSNYFNARPDTNESLLSSKTGSGQVSSFWNGPGPGKYGRVSSIGYPYNDITLCNSPAYTIGRAERNIDLNANPFLALPKSTVVSAAKTPGPASYNYEKYESKIKSSVPAYSMPKAQRFPSIIV